MVGRWSLDPLILVRIQAREPFNERNMAGELASNPNPSEAFQAERSDWSKFGACVVRNVLSPEELRALEDVLGVEPSPFRSPVHQDNRPVGFDRLHYRTLDKRVLLGLPMWENLRQSVLAITGVEHEMHWTGRTQHYPASTSHNEGPHRDYAMRPGAVAATVCRKGVIKATVWPEATGDDHPTGPSKTFEGGPGDVILLDLDDKVEPIPYPKHYSWSRLHRFSVKRKPEVTSITVDFFKPPRDWTIPEEVVMAHLNDPATW